MRTAEEWTDEVIDVNRKESIDRLIRRIQADAVRHSIRKIERNGPHAERLLKNDAYALEQ
jgi:hypothetical protein